MAEIPALITAGGDTAAGATPALPGDRGTRQRGLGGAVSPPREPLGGDTAAMQKGTSACALVSLRVDLQKLHLSHGHCYLKAICTKISSRYLLDFSHFDRLLLSGILGVS